jgi:hypothetical protein
MQALRNVTDIDDLSSANVRTWIDLFFVLSGKANQFEGDVLGDAFYIANKAMSFYESLVDVLQEIEDSVLERLATAIDRVANVASFQSVVTGSNSSLTEVVAANNSYFWSRGLADFGSRYCALQKYDQYFGAADKRFVFDTFRCRVSLVMMNSLQSGQFNVSSVQTAAEELLGIQPTVLTVATKNNSLHIDQPIVVSMVELAGRVYRNERSLNSNPIIVSIDIRGSTFVPSATLSTGFPTDSDRRRYLANFVESVEWDVQHFGPIHKFAYDFVVKNFTSFCFGTKDFSHYTYLCEDSGIALHHYCQGRRGLLLSYCPKPIPGCAQIDGLMDSTADQLERVDLAPLCEVSTFNTTHTTCSCKFAVGADKNYSVPRPDDPSAYYYYYADESTKFAPTVASYMINRDYDVEFGIGNAYTPYRFADTFTETFPPGLSPSPWVLISMFSSLYLLLILFALSRGKYLHLVSSLQKKIVVQDQISPVVTADLGDKVMTPESFFVKYLQFTSSILPAVYSNMPTWQRCRQELLWHHRYLQVLRREEDPAWMSKIVRVIVRIILIHLGIIFVLAVLLDYHIRTGETLCGERLDEQSCLDLTMHLDYTRRACEWEEDPPSVTIIRATDLQPVVIPYHCVFIRDQFTAIGLAVACTAAIVGASVFGQVMSFVLDQFDAQLIPLKLFSTRKQESSEEGYSRQQPKTGRGRHHSAKSYESPGSSSKKNAPNVVEAEPLPINTARTNDTHWVRKIMKRFAEVTRKNNSIGVEQVAAGVKKATKEIMAEEYRLLSPAIKQSFQEIQPFQEVYFAVGNVFRYSTKLSDFLPENRLYLDMQMKSQARTSNNPFPFVSKATIPRREYVRRSSWSTNVAVDSASNVDSVLQNILSNQSMLDWIQVEMNQHNSISIDGMRDVRFLAQDHRQAWQLVAASASIASSRHHVHPVPLPHMQRRIAEVIRDGEHFLSNLRAVPSRQMHAAVELQHLFLVDLLGTDKPEAVIYHRKFHEDQRIAKPLPESTLHLIMVVVGLMLLFLAVYPALIITKQTFTWQWYLLVSIAGCVLMEVFVLATLDCLFFQVWIPGLVWHTVRHAHREAMLHTAFALQELLTARLGDRSGGNAYPLTSRSVMSFNALRGFHVSNYVAQALPGSFEAVLLLFYRDLLPPLRDERTWYERRRRAARPAPFWRHWLSQLFQRPTTSLEAIAPDPSSSSSSSSLPSPAGEASGIMVSVDAAEELRLASLADREDAFAFFRPLSRVEAVLPLQPELDHGRQRGMSQELASRQRLRSRIDSRLTRRTANSVQPDPAASLLGAPSDANQLQHQQLQLQQQQQQSDVFVSQDDEMGLFEREVRAVVRVVSFVVRVIVSMSMFVYNVFYFVLGVTTIALHYRLVALFGNRHISYNAWKTLFAAVIPLFVCSVTVFVCLFVSTDGRFVALDKYSCVLIGLAGVFVLVLLFSALYQHFITVDVLDFPVFVHSDSNTWWRATTGRFGHLIPDELLHDRIARQVEEIQKMERKLPSELSPEYGQDTAKLEKHCEDFMSWRRTQQEMEQLRLKKEQDTQQRSERIERLDAFAEGDEDDEDEGDEGYDSSGDENDKSDEDESESEGSYSDSEDDSDDDNKDEEGSRQPRSDVAEDEEKENADDEDEDGDDDDDDDNEGDVGSDDQLDVSALHQPRAASISSSGARTSGRSSRQRPGEEDATLVTDADVQSAVSHLVNAMPSTYIPSTTNPSPVLRGPMQVSRFASLQFHRANSQQPTPGDHTPTNQRPTALGVPSQPMSASPHRAASLFASTNDDPAMANAKKPFDASPIQMKTRPAGAAMAFDPPPLVRLPRQTWTTDNNNNNNNNNTLSTTTATTTIPFDGRQGIRDVEDPEMQRLVVMSLTPRRHEDDEEREGDDTIQIVIQSHFSPSPLPNKGSRRFAAETETETEAEAEATIPRDLDDDLDSSADDVDEEQGQSTRMLKLSHASSALRTSSTDLATTTGPLPTSAANASVLLPGHSQSGVGGTNAGLRIPGTSPRPQPQAKRAIKVSRASMESMFSVDSNDDNDSVAAATTTTTTAMNPAAAAEAVAASIAKGMQLPPLQPSKSPALSPIPSLTTNPNVITSGPAPATATTVAATTSSATATAALVASTPAAMPVPRSIPVLTSASSAAAGEDEDDDEDDDDDGEDDDNDDDNSTITTNPSSSSDGSQSSSSGDDDDDDEDDESVQTPPMSASQPYIHTVTPVRMPTNLQLVSQQPQSHPQPQVHALPNRLSALPPIQQQQQSRQQFHHLYNNNNHYNNHNNR